jgi:DnaK suppressor protein
MDIEMQAQFKACLETRLRDLIHDRRTGLSSSITDVSDAFDPKDSADMAATHCDRELLQTFRHRSLRLMEEILSALQRIEEGEFGVCEECAEPIGLGRMRAHPTTVLCIDCKKRQEATGRLDAA